MSETKFTPEWIKEQRGVISSHKERWTDKEAFEKYAVDCMTFYPAALDRIEELEAEVARLNKLLTDRLNGVWG